MAQYLIPGIGFIDDVDTGQYLIPGAGFIDAPAGESVSFKPLGIINGVVKQLNPGSGVKPLVMVNGRLQERTSDEGVPVILDGEKLRTIGVGESIAL